MNRILKITNISQAKAELKKINVSTGGIDSMYSKMNGINLKLENVELAAANILKQEMLSLGGDAGVARGVVNGTLPFSDVILMGNEIKLRRLAAKLGHQKYFKLPAIREDILRLLDNRHGEANNQMNIGEKCLDLNHTQIIGILNITPDSFSDGNQFISPVKAVDQARKMISEGAVIIDIGGESTRPGAQSISIEEELRRTIDVIKSIRAESDVLISIDTTKAEVARKAIRSGADIINDISALRFDPNMVQVLKEFPQTAVILMHSQGKPRTMQINPEYDDTIREITDFLQERINFCLQNGIDKKRIMIDPGIGFGKRHSDNLIILQRLSEFHCLSCPVVLGASRKSFISRIYQSHPQERTAGTLATTSLAYESGIHFVRVHDVNINHQILQVLDQVRTI